MLSIVGPPLSGIAFLPAAAPFVPTALAPLALVAAVALVGLVVGELRSRPGLRRLRSAGLRLVHSATAPASAKCR